LAAGVFTAEFLAKVREELQREGEPLAEYVRYLSGQEVPPEGGEQAQLLPRLRLEGALLFRWCAVQRQWLLCLPAVVREEAVLRVHRSTGHFGPERTLAAVASVAWTKSLPSLVRRVLRECEVCARGDSRTVGGGALQPLPVASGPFTSLSLDFASMQKVVVDGEEFDRVLAVVCRYSKYVFAVPCRSDLTAAGAARLMLRHVLPVAGVPRDLVSDGDALFTARVWRELWASLGTDLRVSSPGHAQSDGQTERVFRWLRGRLRAAEQRGVLWPVALAGVVLAYNGTVHATTGVEPARAALGRVPAMPWGQPPQGAGWAEMAELLPAVHMALEDAQGHMARAYDKRVRPRPAFAAGEWVYVRTARLGRTPLVRAALRAGGPKAVDPWAGPFVVLRGESRNVLQVDFPPGIGVSDRVNVKDVKRAVMPPPGSGRRRPVGPLFAAEGELFYPKRVTRWMFVPQERGRSVAVEVELVGRGRPVTVPLTEMAGPSLRPWTEEQLWALPGSMPPHAAWGQ